MSKKKKVILLVACVMLIVGIVITVYLYQNRENKLQDGYVKDNLAQFLLEDKYENMDEFKECNDTKISSHK